MASVTYSRRVGHVRESPVAQVAVEGVPWRRVRLGAHQGSAVEEIDVDQTVSIIVEGSKPRSHILHDVVSTAAAVGMPEGNSSLLGHVAKDHRSHFALRAGDQKDRSCQRGPPWDRTILPTRFLIVHLNAPPMRCRA